MSSSNKTTSSTNGASSEETQQQAFKELVESVRETFRPYGEAARNMADAQKNLWEVTLYSVFLQMCLSICLTCRDFLEKGLARERVILEKLLDPCFTSTTGIPFSIIELVDTALGICSQFSDADFKATTMGIIYSFPKKQNFDKRYNLTHAEQDLKLCEVGVERFIVLIKLMRTLNGFLIRKATGDYNVPTKEQCKKLFYKVQIAEDKYQEKKSSAYTSFMEQWVDVANMFEGLKPELSDVLEIFTSASQAATAEIAAKAERHNSRLTAGVEAGWNVSGLRKIPVRQTKIPAPAPAPTKAPVAAPAKAPVVAPFAATATAAAAAPVPASGNCWGGKFNPVTGATIELSAPVPVTEPVTEPVTKPVTEPVIHRQTRRPPPARRERRNDAKASQAQPQSQQQGRRPKAPAPVSTPAPAPKAQTKVTPPKSIFALLEVEEC